MLSFAMQFVTQIAEGSLCRPRFYLASKYNQGPTATVDCFKYSSGEQMCLQHAAVSHCVITTLKEDRVLVKMAGDCKLCASSE